MEQSQTLQEHAAELRQQVEQNLGPETQITREQTRDYMGQIIEKEKVKVKVPDTNLPTSEVKAPEAVKEIPINDKPGVESKVQELGKMADTNLQSAIQEALNTHNPEIIDAFHELITDKLFDHLVESKQLEKLSA